MCAHGSPWQFQDEVGRACVPHLLLLALNGAVIGQSISVLPYESYIRAVVNCTDVAVADRLAIQSM
jgi:hypothetical protein